MLHHESCQCFASFVTVYLSEGHLLRPFSVAYTKGYKRCLILLVTIQGIRELELADSVPSFVRVAWLGFSWIFGMFGS